MIKILNMIDFHILKEYYDSYHIRDIKFKRILYNVSSKTKQTGIPRGKYINYKLAKRNTYDFGDINNAFNLPVCIINLAVELGIELKLTNSLTFFPLLRDLNISKKIPIFKKLKVGDETKEIFNNNFLKLDKITQIKYLLIYADYINRSRILYPYEDVIKFNEIDDGSVLRTIQLIERALEMMKNDNIIFHDVGFMGYCVDFEINKKKVKFNNKNLIQIHGDLDFITDNSIIDIKCTTKNKITSNITQEYIYYLLLKNGCSNLTQDEYEKVKNVKFLTTINPLTGERITYDIKNIDEYGFIKECLYC